MHVTIEKATGGFRCITVQRPIYFIVQTLSKATSVADIRIVLSDQQSPRNVTHNQTIFHISRPRYVRGNIQIPRYLVHH